MLRFGLCCIFRNEPIRFRQTTAKELLALAEKDRLEKISTICLENANSLLKALQTVHRFGIGAFRVSSQFLPRYTHPEVGYTLDSLPDVEAIVASLEKAHQLRDERDIRLSFHPDQFVLLSSPRAEVTRKSIAELDYQAMLAEMLGADVVNIHAGGVYGDKQAAIKRLRDNFQDLPERVQSRLTLENDDVSYTVNDLLPICDDLGLPLVYDVHHHRCNPDGLSVQEATDASLQTWQKARRGEAYFHLSSPKNGWQGKDPKPHAEMIDINDFPQQWIGLDVTIDIEAKAKELAVLEMMRKLAGRDRF
jgi:UV DNA damage endonuclease